MRAPPFAKGKSGNPNGRPKGIPNKVTTDLRQMILGALDQAGGQDYLAQQALDNPAPFLALVGKVLPAVVTGDAGNPIVISVEERIATTRRILDAAFAQVVGRRAMPPPSGLLVDMGRDG